MDHQLAEKECAALAGLFQQIVVDMKNSTPVWEEFTAKAARLQVTLRSTVLATSAFLEAFQKVADMATNTRGATKDIGSALTRLCMRHRNIELKMKHMTGSIVDMLVTPLQDRLEDWKKVAVQLDKDHGKESKKAQQEVRKAASDTSRLQKKVKKGRADAQSQLDLAMNELRQKIQTLQEVEKNAVRAALIEERSRYCLFIGAIKPFMDGEISLLGDVMHLQEIMDSLCSQAADPHLLPAASEQVLADMSGSNVNWTSQTPPRSPALSMTSSKSSTSSICSTQSPIHRRNNNAENSVSDGDSASTTQDSAIVSMTTASPQSAPAAVAAVPSPSSSGSAVPTMELCRGLSWSPSSGGGCGHRHQGDVQQVVLDPSRPHTISSAYERLHCRPALTERTFEPILQSLHHHHHHHHPNLQGHSLGNCCGGGGGTGPIPYTVMAHHRSLAMVAPRPRPHSLSRDIKLDDIIYQTTRQAQHGTTSGTTALEGGCSQSQSSQNVSIGNSNNVALNDKGQITSDEYRSRVKSFSETQQPSCTEVCSPLSQTQQPSCTETVKSLTEAIRRLEANARDSDFDIPSQRALHHSVSCGTIIVDHRTVGHGASDISASGRLIEDGFHGVSRRSSMYNPVRPTSPVRRATSMVVPMSDIDSCQSRFNDGDITSLPQRMTQSDIVLRHQSSEFNRKSQTYRSSDEEEEENGCFFDDGLLLPPSPFRSPEFAVDGDAGTNGHVISTSSAYPVRVDGDRYSSQSAKSRLFPMRIGEQRAAGLGGEGRDRLLWMPMSSPDDVTPTNENQPTPSFGQQIPKSPAPNVNQTGSQFMPVSEAEVPDLYQLRYSEL